MISIVIPSRNRINGLLRAIASTSLTTRKHDVEIIAVLDEPDEESIEFTEHLCGLRVVVMPPTYAHGHPQEKYQAGYRASKGDWIVTGADDITFCSGWLDAALKHKNKGFVGFWEKHHKGRLAPLFMVSRKYIQTVMNGHLGLPWYRVWWADNEWKARAERARAWTVCRKAEFEHHHAKYIGKMDDVARLSEKFHNQDKATFNARKKAGFPEKWPAAK